VGWGDAIRPEVRLTSLPNDVNNCLVFLEEYCKHSGTPRTEIEAHIPAFVFNQFKH
jgi:hypothetical protein